MTNSEAIETLQANYPDSCYGLLRDAVDMAIFALKQPEIIRCKDCKHRPTATEADENIYIGFSVEFPDGVCPCQCEDGWYNWYPEDNFYCGKAERRGES